MSSFIVRILSRILFQLFKRNKLYIKVVYKSGLKIRFPLHYYFSNIEDLFELYSEYYLNEYKKFFGEELQFKENDIIIDIGAHIGTFSLPISYYYKPNVYAFEPNISNYQCLIYNVRVNSLNDRIHPYNMAVSKENKFIEFNEGDASTRGFLTHNKFHKTTFEGTTYQVETVSLNDFIKKEKIQTIDILKIDCEGAEYDIIYNLDNTIFSIIKLIFIEIHPINKGYNPKKLIRYIEDMGFKGEYRILDNGCFECVFVGNKATKNQ
jgi:FkbM family methyltransferase